MHGKKNLLFTNLQSIPRDVNRQPRKQAPATGRLSTIRFAKRKVPVGCACAPASAIDARLIGHYQREGARGSWPAAFHAMRSAVRKRHLEIHTAPIVGCSMGGNNKR